MSKISTKVRAQSQRVAKGGGGLERSSQKGAARARDSSTAKTDAAIRYAANRAHPPLSDVEAEARHIRVDRDGLVRCRCCGCTAREPCNPPCGWYEVDLCTGCSST